jgi:transposase-like protein
MTDALRAPKITASEITELRALRGTGPVPDAFLARLAEHYQKAEADGVLNPARHLAEHLGVQRQTVITYMRMARNRRLVSKNRP